MTQTSPEPHQVTLDSRQRATLTGVTDVERFDDTCVVLHTHGGRLTITGSSLHVSSLQLEAGKLLVDGEIDSFAYDKGMLRRKGGFLRRALG